MALKFDADYLSLAIEDKQLPNKDDIQLIRHDIGKLKSVTGKLVACDPYVMEYGTSTFTQDIPIGEYPVKITIAKYANEDERINFATIRFGDSTPIRWELMVFPGQNISSLKKQEFFGYGVDTGTGCFVDSKVARAISKNKSVESIFDKLSKDMDSRYKYTRSWGSVDVADGNIIAFSSGWGDGSYPTFAGFDDDNQLTAIVTDFLCLYHDYYETENSASDE